MARFTVASGTVTFDDGGMNLLSSDALRELRDAIAAAASSEPPALVFRSGRPGLFAAGADMAEMERFSPLEALAFARLGQEVFAAIEKLPALTVAVIDGDCFGGALDLAFAFDLRLAGPRARFSHPGAKLGIATGFGGTTRWRRVLPPAGARRLFLGNEVMSADEALAAGLADALGEELPATWKSLDSRTVRMVKELTIHGGRLSQQELLLLADRLGEIYGTR
jgi:enoyl-CoA hydratase